MKGGARRKTLCSDLPPPIHPFQNEIVDEVNEHLPTNDDGENGGNEYEEEEYDGESGGRVDGGENEGAEGRPKLAEGFYEIEALRKKRIRKGVKQYLIKWRGWPESGNTWEPVESLTSCLDLIEEFESSNSGKRGRKRKHSVGPLSQSKNNSMGIKVEESNVVVTSHNGPANQSNGFDNNLDEVKPPSPVDPETTTDFAIHIQEDPAEPVNVASKVDGTEVCQSRPRVGARRRKSCAVKRFTKELNSISKQDLMKKTSNVIMEDDIKKVDDVANGLDSEPKVVSAVTKILKPVNYSTFELNGIEEVCVSFLVMRSDGKEIVVDNKYLKENNPVLLINFYEQHLRYNNQSE